MSDAVQKNKVPVTEWYKAVDTGSIYREEEKAISAAGEDIKFMVKHSIPFEKMFDLANDVAAVCVVDGVWHRVVFDLMVNYYIINYFTDLDCDVDVDRIYELIHHTNVIESVKNVIGENQYAEIYEMAVSACESVQAKAYSEVRVLAGRINKFLDTMDEQIKSLGIADPGEFEKLADKISSLMAAPVESNTDEPDRGKMIEMKGNK